ncbi:UNVERIFIED_CONTAM: Ankyrin-3 [Trichonephila clavipes]
MHSSVRGWWGSSTGLLDPNEERPQDFELIELLIREAAASTSVQQSSGVDESFKARFQSYIDQVPSYMHSVEKKGFFPHFFFGSFSTLLGTEIAEKLGIKEISFRFDTKETLKVVVIKDGEIKNDRSAIDNIKLFSISESKDGSKGQFTSGELEEILKKNLIWTDENTLIGEVRAIKDRIKGRDEMKPRLVRISKGKDGISVKTEVQEISDSAASHGFHKIEKGLWSKPEDDIAKLTGSNKERVKESSSKVLKKIGEIHSKYENSLSYAKGAREAAHHGFVAGALNNFRYRHNLRVYLEQFAGRGYSDIVLLARGPDRALNSVPIVIELKAGGGPNLTPDKALEQAEKYAQGFQPNVQRVLTTADDILCVGVNFDYPSPISDIEAKSRETAVVPLFQDVLESTDRWSRNGINEEELKTRIQDNIERVYNTFPGTSEKGDNHYFSRVLLGQSLLSNKVLKSDCEKYIFIYGENIPTETHVESSRPQRPAGQRAKDKMSTGLDKSHAVVSMVLIPKNDEKLVYVVNVVEADGRDEILRKGAPLDNLNQKIGNRKIAELNLNFNVKKQKSDFKEYFNIEANEYASLEQYNNKRTDKFQGTFENVPYPNELKETFDRALDSQLTSAQSSSIGEYNELFKKLGEAIFPFKSLVNGENDFQAVLDGAFNHYSDLRLQESPETRALVLTEFQTGRGKRADMLVHGIKFEGDAKEYTPIGLELKLSRQGKGAALLKKAEGQINEEYKKGVTYKTLTDGDEVKFIGVVFDKKASDANSLVLASRTSEEGFIPVKVVHSSTHVLPTVDRLDLNSCLGQGNRKKRSTNGCLFSWNDIDKFNNAENVDKRNKGKIKINSEKFLTYIKDSQDEGKNAQLVEFIGEKITPNNVEGNHKYLLNEVVRDGGYVNYAQNRRIKDLQGDVLQQNNGLTKSSKLKSRLMNAAGGIQLIRGIHGAIVSCTYGTATDCGLNLGGIAWSFASQPIENVMVKITPKLVKQTESVAGKVISGTLGKQTKFAIRVVGVKFGTTVAKGVAGALTGVFDIVDIGMSASNLVDCKNRKNGDNPCGEKEIRDNIASISFSGVSFVSGIALTAASMPGVGILVGLGLMVGHGVYSGVSNIIEYKKKYDTTHDENWRIFWHTIAFQPIPVDVQHLAARQSIVNSLAQEAWKALSNSTSDVVAYGIGFGEVSNNAFHPSNAKIIMNRDNADTASLSRVIPDLIPNAEMICLPHITDADYEKDRKKSVPTAIRYCDNAMVIADKRRESSGKTIIYDLKNIDKGVIVGSNKLNNSFLIFQGATKITGGDNVVNRFAFVNNSSLSSKVIGGSNSTNTLDLSQLKDKLIKANVNDVHRSLKVKINDHLLIDDSAGNNLFSYRYVGRQNKVDKILCTGYSEPLTGNSNRDIIIDSGGGFDNDVEDVVENCEKVIISPYTTVKGGEGNYTFYVKTAGYKGRDLHSEINVNGTGTIIFQETDLLSDLNEITYSSNNNTLSLKIGLDQNNQYTLNVKNYIEQSSNKPNFILVDKNGSNIVPKIGKSESFTVKINSFELHTEYSLDDFDSVENHYKEILNNDKDYKVFGVVRDKVQGQSNSAVPRMMFGSSGNDIVNFDQGTMFAKGGKGHDIYAIGSDIGDREVVIDNNSDDEKLDVLSIPEVPEEFSIQQYNLHLNYGDTHIQVKNYLQDNSYRHLMVMNSKGETFIPYMQSILHADSSSVDNGKLVPFFHATQAQNMFFLSKDFQYDHVAIDSRSEDIERYKDKGDLLLMREGEVPFTMKIKGYFDDQIRWKDVNFHLWNNGNFSNFDLPQEADEVMSYQDKLKADRERIIKEYVIDFTQSLDIAHNQNDDLTSVRQDEEHIGVIVLKGITPDQVKVSSSGSDLVLHDTKSNRTINIKNWDSSESNRISTLEFDLGLDPIVIRRLNRFSLSNVEEIQALIDKASENYQNRAAGTETENDFKCLVSVNGFESGNKTYECLGFSSLQDQINFTEKLCSVEQIEEFKNKMQNSDQALTLLKKLKDDLSLSGYDQNAIGQCNELVVASEFKPLISKLAQEGEWNKVKAFLDETANRSSTDIENKNKWSESWTLLHYAVYNGNLNLVNGVFDLLLAKVGDINAKDKWYWTPLHYAVCYNEPNMVKFLIDKGANIEARSKRNETPLYLAVKEDKLDVVKSFFGKNIGGNPYKMMKLITSLEEEIISRANTPSDVKEWLASYVSSLRDSIKGIAKKELKNDMLDDSYASTTELANKIYKFDGKLFGEIIKKVVNDLYKEIDTEEVLSFIRSYNFATQRIQGYVAVFDKMKRENSLNNNAVFNLAFYVKEVMEAGDYSSVNSEKRSELEEIKKELPESLGNLVFSSKVCIKNVEYRRYLYSPNDYKGFQFDDERRRVFTWSSNLGGDEFKWKVELNGDSVYLKNVKYGGYLYSPNDHKDFQFDNERRRMFIWPSNLGGDKFKWKVELNGDSVYLKNVEYGRYLYSPNDYRDFQFDSERRRVFTWPSNLGGDKFKWKVENCGSTREIRDIQHHRNSLQEEEHPVYLESREVDPRKELRYLVNEAARNGEWDIVNFFLDKTAERSPDYIAIKDQFSTSWTTLHYAVYNGDLNLIRDVFHFLSNKNTIINAGDGADRTPLHYAVLYGSSDMVELLMDEGADIWIEDREEKTPLKVAREHNRSEILKYLVEHKGRDGGTPLYFTAEIGDLDRARFLLDSGADIESKNGEYQATPLHGAVANYRLDVVRLLLSRSANVNAEDKGHQTPLHYAANTDRLDIVKSLVDAGADPSTTDDYGKTPLNIAKDKGHISIAEYLEKKLNEKGEKPVQRKRRRYSGDHDRHHSSRKLLATDLSDQSEMAARQDILKDSLQNDEIGYNQATSGASKPSLLINVFAHIVNAVKGVSQFISSPFRPAIDSQVGNTSKIVPEIKNISAQSDINGGILLFDVLLAKKGRRQIYTPSVDKQVSSLEAQAYALNIVNEFEPILKQAALRCGISVQQLKVDFQELHSSVLKKIMAGDYRGVSGILYSAAEKACPALEQKKKFSMSFKGKVEQMLQKEMMPLLDKGNIDPSSVSTNKAAALPSPRTNLNNISVTNNSTELIR